MHLTVSHLRVYRTVYGIHIPDKVRFMSITDKVRYIRITDKVRYTCNTDFVYNGQKTLVPTGTLYARFTVYRKYQSNVLNVPLICRNIWNVAFHGYANKAIYLYVRQYRH